MDPVEVDDRGRITIPAEIRDCLSVEPGDELDVQVRDGGIFLRPVVDPLSDRPSLVTVRRDDRWGEEAFLDAGDGTFEDR